MCSSAVALGAATRLLPKTRRLTAKSEFDRVFSQGRGVKRQGIRVIWAPGTGKAAVVVARAVGSIARRNTIRRRWREALTPETLPEAFDIVLVVGVEASHLKGEAVRQELSSLLAEVGR